MLFGPYKGRRSLFLKRFCSHLFSSRGPTRTALHSLAIYGFLRGFPVEQTTSVCRFSLVGDCERPASRPFFGSISRKRR